MEIWSIEKGMFLEIDRVLETGYIHIEFRIDIMHSPNENYRIVVYRNETVHVEIFGSRPTKEFADEEVFVRDLALVDPEKRFVTKDDAEVHLQMRIREMFGS